MNPDLKNYIKTKRDAGLKDDQIRANLVAGGWQAEMVDAALNVDLDSDVPLPPPPPAPTPVTGATAPNHPVAVVNLATTKGIEYSIMFISMWISAMAIGSLLHASVDTISGKESYIGAITPFAAAALLVALPIFAILFLRLKKAEISKPELRSDPSRKRAIQLTLLVTFLIGIGKIIGYIFSLMNGGGEGSLFYDYSSESSTAISPVFDLIHTVITLGIAGGIFAYYWRDMHKEEN